MQPPPASPSLPSLPTNAQSPVGSAAACLRPWPRRQSPTPFCGPPSGLAGAWWPAWPPPRCGARALRADCPRPARGQPRPLPSRLPHPRCPADAAAHPLLCRPCRAGRPHHNSQQTRAVRRQNPPLTAKSSPRRRRRRSSPAAAPLPRHPRRHMTRPCSCRGCSTRRQPATEACWQAGVGWSALQPQALQHWIAPRRQHRHRQQRQAIRLQPAIAPSSAPKRCRGAQPAQSLMQQKGQWQPPMPPAQASQHPCPAAPAHLRMPPATPC